MHTYMLHMTIGLPLVGVLLASLLLNPDAMVYLEKPNRLYSVGCESDRYDSSPWVTAFLL